MLDAVLSRAQIERCMYVITGMNMLQVSALLTVECEVALRYQRAVHKTS
jgi:hypothetical protein